MANFAKAQLMKYGWTEGKGLGKNENGITEAIRPSLKFDTQGIGHTSKSENWWEDIFNKAAKNVNVNVQNNEVSFTINTRETALDQIVNKSSLSSYKSFLKTATLQNGNVTHVNTFNNKNQEESEKEIVQLTDEELFKACGGRTAHKGARHGLKLNGKLERIAQQERMLLGVNSNEKNTQFSFDTTSRCREPKKVDSDSDDEQKTEENILPESVSYNEEIKTFIKSKSWEKRHRKRMNQLSSQLDKVCSIAENKTELDSDSGIKKESPEKNWKRNKNKKPYSRSKNHQCSKSKPKSTENLDVQVTQLSEEKATDNQTSVHVKCEKHKRKHSRSCLKRYQDCRCSNKKKRKEKRRLGDGYIYSDGNLIPIFNKHKHRCSDETTKETESLNAKIHKKKKKSSKHSLRKLLMNMTDSHCDAKDNKEYKKGISEKKLEAIMQDLMAVNLMDNVSENIKSNEKKVKKEKALPQ